MVGSKGLKEKAGTDKVWRQRSVQILSTIANGDLKMTLKKLSQTTIDRIKRFTELILGKKSGKPKRRSKKNRIVRRPNTRFYR